MPTSCATVTRLLRQVVAELVDHLVGDGSFLAYARHASDVAFAGEFRKFEILERDRSSGD